MADRAPFESPVTTRYPATIGAVALVLADESATTKLIVRTATDTGIEATATLGVPFGASRRHDGALVVGQRPGEWVVLGTPAAAAGVVDDLEGEHLGVIDVTHGRALFRLTGDHAARTLEKLCNLDWGDDMTPDGAVVSGSVAAVNCDLVRHDRDGSRSYLITCDRSLGQYLFDAVLDAGREFGIVAATD